jgi:hypothetical protein
VRVGERLDPPHHVRGFVAPLVADERRHVDAGAVFGLQRAVVLVDDQRDEVGHERRVPVSVARVGHATVAGGDSGGMQADAAVRADQTLIAVEAEDLHAYIFP